MINLRLAKKEDLEILAEIYKGLYGDLYKKQTLNEDWSIEKSYNLLWFFYKLQLDLFIVAEVDGKVVGAVMSIVNHGMMEII